MRTTIFQRHEQHSTTTTTTTTITTSSSSNSKVPSPSSKVEQRMMLPRSNHKFPFLHQPVRSSRKAIAIWVIVILAINAWVSMILVSFRRQRPQDPELFMWNDPCIWFFSCKADAPLAPSSGNAIESTTNEATNNMSQPLTSRHSLPDLQALEQQLVIVPSKRKGSFSYGRQQILSSRTIKYLWKYSRFAGIQKPTAPKIMHLAKLMAKRQEDMQQRIAGRVQARMRTDLRNEYSNNNNNNNDLKNHMSACLLIKDDNDILSEWIAYHYHTFKMRYLVVAVDPSSLSSPLEILRPWMKHTNLKVSLWTDKTYMPRSFLKQGYVLPEGFDPTKTNLTEWLKTRTDFAEHMDLLQVATHRYRQKTFLLQCMQHLARQNKTWVMHIDTDEYVAINPVLRQKIQHVAAAAANGTNVTDEGTPLDYPPSLQKHVPLDGPRTKNCIFNFMQQLMLHDEAMRSQYPCLSMPRFLFGSVEDANNTDVSSSLDRSLHFESLRWQYHSGSMDEIRSRYPKVIMDVSQMFHGDFVMRREVHSIHRPSYLLCRSQDEVHMWFFQRNPIVVNHYLGSWERYSARSDSRRSREIYDSKANLAAGRDNWVSAWLDGFIEEHGPDLSTLLLGNRVSLPATSESLPVLSE